jgi:hypothetical protein
MRKHAQVTISDYQQIVTVYQKESDRAAAILAAAFVDVYLAGYMQACVADDPECRGLFEETAPLGTFAARAKVAHAFDLIPPEIASDLRYIRKIRNLFAHDISDLSFSSPPVRDLCSNLSMAKPIPKPEGGVLVEINPRDQYLLSVGMAVAVMHNRRLAREQGPVDDDA